MEIGEIVAQVAHELLDPGPMSRQIRRAEYHAFITANFDDTPMAPVFNSGGTHCAIFARGCLSQAGVMPRGKRPRITGITTWLGVRGFVEDDPDTVLIEGAWIPVDELVIQPGDVLFWTGYRGQTEAQWGASLNGHVGVALFDGEGWVHQTAEGGGGIDGSTCRKSDGPKDVRMHGARPLRGVWRPALMVTGGT